MKHPSQCSQHRLQGRFLLKKPTPKKKYNLETLFLFTIHTQIHTNTSIVPHKYACPRIPVPSIPWLSQYCRCLSIDYIAKILCIQVRIRRKKFLAERGDWCKKQYLSPGVVCKGNSRGYPVHQQTGPWQLMNSECWPSFPHLRNTTPSANWADPLSPQASLFSKDMARHPLLGISGAIKDVTALRYMWPFSSWGYSRHWWRLTECIST